jgi:hypothetical protein
MIDTRRSPRRRALGIGATLTLCAALTVTLAACVPQTRITPGGTATPATNFCTPPTLDPSAIQAVTDVVHTTTMSDWEAGGLSPRNSFDSFAKNQALITAIKVGTNYPGVFTVNNIFCSDGHENSETDDWQIQVPAKSAGSWVTGQVEWVRSTSNPQNVGRVMQLIYWDGFLAHVSFLTILPSSQDPQPCPAAPSHAVPGLTITNAKLSAPTVTEEGVSRFTVFFDSSVRGVFTFFLCRDGSTVDDWETTLGVGTNQYVYVYRDMVRNSELNCPDCDLSGAARWIVTFNHHVVAQAPFTITQ